MAIAPAGANGAGRCGGDASTGPSRRPGCGRPLQRARAPRLGEQRGERAGSSCPLFHLERRPARCSLSSLASRTCRCRGGAGLGVEHGRWSAIGEARSAGGGRSGHTGSARVRARSLNALLSLSRSLEPRFSRVRRSRGGGNEGVVGVRVWVWVCSGSVRRGARGRRAGARRGALRAAESPPLLLLASLLCTSTETAPSLEAAGVHVIATQ